KLFKQRVKMEANREYAQRLQDTVDEIVMNNPRVESKFLKKNTSEVCFTVVFGSDLGLCGSYNQNVFKYAEAHLKKEDPIVLI
ncbi:F0F1 ATP synthase subunit gamma, partial [Acinetobacter baumannii]|nr:F0F1 ATP synthase subunit gamma [Acinetobacter baumannii]